MKTTESLLLMPQYTYSAYYAYKQHILFIIIKHILHILHIQCENTCTRLSQFIDTIAWLPVPGPSYLRTTTYNHHHCSLICRRMLRESLLILVAWQRVLSRLHPPGLEEGVPEWRILEPHTRLVLAHVLPIGPLQFPGHERN